MLFTMVVPVAFAESTGTYSIAFETNIKSDEIIANAVYTPVGNETKSFTAILALYTEDKELLDFVAEKSVNNVARVSIPNQENGYMVKAYVWDSLTGMNYLTETIYTAKSDFMEATEFVDFIVDVETGREPVILQLTDTQIPTSVQMDAKCFDYLRETVEATNPDLILVTGDLLFGRDDTNGSILEEQIEVFESFKIPWAPVFGNHDNESPMGADWQCEQFENAEYCLFKQRTLTGNGNYTVGIRQGGALKRVFFMMDSNGCTKASEESLANGHTKVTTGFGSDQVMWFRDVATKINRVAPGMKYTFAFHIQSEIFRTALSQYGTVNENTINNPINIDKHENKKDTDFGYLGRDLKSSWDTDYSVYTSMKNLGCDSILVGHEHCNSASVVYDGVRFQYGQKSSVYDRANYVTADGNIVGSTSTAGIPMIGGTVMKMSETDGSFSNNYIFYCDTGFDDILNKITVPGMQVGDGLSYREGSTVEAVEIDGVPAYKIAAEGTRGRVYVDLDEIANKKTFTFSALVPEGTTMISDNGSGEIQIRVKGVSGHSGYVYFSSASTDETTKVPLGEWKTYTVDISSFGDSCTEFAFTFPTYSTVYIKDVAVDGEATEDEEITVSGLQIGTDLKVDSDMVIEKTTVAGQSAFSVYRGSSGKVYMNVDDIANGSTLTFSAYVPTGAGAISGGSGGEVNIRWKKSGGSNGYFFFKSTSANESTKVPFDEWKTYTIDISGYGSDTSEFSFVIAVGSTVYLKDITIE